MIKRKPGFTSKLIVAIVSAAMIWTLPLATTASAQGAYRSQSRYVTEVPAGTTIYVRTTDDIDADAATGQTYNAEVDQPVLNDRGAVVIPQGAPVDLVVRQLSGDELALDLQSITINGQPYTVQAPEATVTPEGKEGLGANKRTGVYVGGGALLGAIIGAIAGGGKGAAIGAGAGAGAGAAAQVLTRGKSVHVPAETQLAFTLQEPLRPGSYSYSSNSNSNYSNSSRYGYQRGIGSLAYTPGLAAIYVGPDNMVSWQGPDNARIYVQADNQAPTLFSANPSGPQSASWMSPGHVYTFTMRDQSGREIARSQVDLRTAS